MSDEPIDNHDSLPPEDFAAMLEESMTTIQHLKPGQKVNATVLQIGDETIFLDVGQKGEGILDVKELQDADGAVKAAVGDSLSVYFLGGRSDELKFTTRLGGGSSGTAQLEEAWRSSIPVDGRIEKEIKGGFEIRLPGNVRAFCPFSQIGLRRDQDDTVLIGENLAFRITQFSEQGRNIVVSHRILLEEERQQQQEALQKTLKEGMTVTGTVTNIRDFGAFLDIGGIEGLVPISELSYGHVDNVNDLLDVGQTVEVVVKKIDWEKQRFSFSLRDTLTDPWCSVQEKYPLGSKHMGTVSRLAKFGAFVTLEDGIDGLLHISKIGGDQRIKHPQDVLTPGQVLEVIIEKVETGERRISLTMAGSDEGSPAETSYSEEAGSGMGTFADLFKQARKNK